MLDQQALAAIARLVGLQGLTYVKTLTSAVTTAWGVSWDEVYIARDLMQNFFDANRDRLDEVQVEVHGANVHVVAPAPCNLERLFYLGSRKGDDDIGQYGEGFKVAATCLLRDHAVRVIACSDRDVLSLRVADQAVSDTELYPVEYDFCRSDETIHGTKLLLAGCSRKLATAMSEGLNHFWHEGNPLLGLKRWSDHHGDFSIFEATDGKGHVFYRGLQRGEIEDIALVLVIGKRYAAIERKVSQDRDRNAFGDEVMELFYRHFARFGLHGHVAGQRVIVEAARPIWHRGHPLLSAMASATCGWPAAQAQEVFGTGYYARSAALQAVEQLESERLERNWRNQGKQCLPAYFSNFSVLNARDVIRQTREKAFEDSKRHDHRAPTTAEMDGVRVLSQALRDLAPEVGAVFDKGTTQFSVAQTEALLGELRLSRANRSREVFLGADVFLADFPAAFAIFLHEHAHIFGQDGSRGFTDALTELIETVVRCRRQLDPYEEGWNAASAAVQRERQAIPEVVGPEPMKEWLDGLSKVELRKLMRRLPKALLKRLQNGQNQAAP